MKIYSNDQILKNLYPETNNKTRPNAGKEFGAVLKETVENTKKAEPATQQMKLLNPLSGVHLTPRSVQDKTVTIERIEKMIDLLDQYRQMLADPKISLKNMDPVVMEMAREKEKMATALDSMQDGEELKNILNQTLVTATLEISKFYRGDYIAA
jgi:hypothetical protein